MSHTITPSEDKSHIILKVIGDLTTQLAVKQDLEAHALGRQLGIDRFLVDLTEARNVESVFENYNFAYKDMNTEGINRQAHVVLLVSPQDHSHDFVETVARNAGLDVTLFREREPAMRHLMQGW